MSFIQCAASDGCWPGCSTVAVRNCPRASPQLGASIKRCSQYYVDEIYAAVFVKPLIEGSTTILWHGVTRT